MFTHNPAEFKLKGDEQLVHDDELMQVKQVDIHGLQI